MYCSSLHIILVLWSYKSPELGSMAFGVTRLQIMPELQYMQNQVAPPHLNEAPSVMQVAHAGDSSYHGGGLRAGRPKQDHTPSASCIGEQIYAQITEGLVRCADFLIAWYLPGSFQGPVLASS